MFGDCHKLKSLNLNHFITSQVENMTYMFTNCYELTDLNIDNFDFSNVVNIQYMFLGCHNLKNIDLKNIKIQENSKITQLIGNNIKNLAICLNDISLIDKIISLYDWPYVNCNSNWGEKKDKISPPDNNKCLNNCLLMKYKSRCYQICSYYFYFDEFSNKYKYTQS